MRINFTSYDVRRDYEIINPNTDHKDILILSPEDPDNPGHQYRYARVLGIYHVNVIYTGSNTGDYRPRRMEFLWVRWFTVTNNEPVQNAWSRRRLDVLKLMPVMHEDAFGFLDPAEVIRCAHLIPRFSEGQKYVDGKGISACAQDAKDWHQYMLGR
jgi:hypothetical protein